MAFAIAFDEQHHFARCRERVLAAAHRNGARVSGETGYRHAQARRAGDRSHDADREALVQQHRALLDVRLDERDDVLAAPVDIAPAIRIAAEVDERLPHRDALVVGLVEPSRLEAAGHRLAPDQRRAEAHAFLVAEADNFERVRQALAAVVQVLHAGDGGEDAEQPIVLARVSHAVLVRAGHHDGRIRIYRFVPTDDVAERIEPRCHASAAHQADQVLAGLLVLLA